MTKKKFLVCLLLVVLVFSGMMYYYHQYQNRKYELLNTKYTNTGFVLDSLVLQNGDLWLRCNQLTVSEKDLSERNKNLEDDIKALNLKIKNLQSATKVEIKYVYKVDTVFVAKPVVDSAGVYRINIDDKWLKFGCTLNTNPEPPTISDVSAYFPDSLTIINEYETKRKWFLFIPVGRKVVGNKVYIKSDNPYSRIETFETFNFDNRLNRKNRK